MAGPKVIKDKDRIRNQFHHVIVPTIWSRDRQAPDVVDTIPPLTGSVTLRASATSCTMSVSRRNSLRSPVTSMTWARDATIVYPRSVGYLLRNATTCLSL